MSRTQPPREQVWLVWKEQSSIVDYELKGNNYERYTTHECLYEILS